MEKNHLLKILSSLIVKFSDDVQAENFYFQVKFINCYLREIISYTKKIDIREWGQSRFIQASLSEIQGLFKDFLRLSYSFQGLKVYEKS